MALLTLRKDLSPRNMSTESSNTREHTPPIDNYRTSPYGRFLSRRVAGQKLTREARAVAFVDHVDVDAPCCHPRLLMLTLHAHGLWDQDRLPLIQKFCAKYKQWREGIAAYLSISFADEKVELIKLFYGARPTIQLPWILVVSSEIVDASNLLLACPELAGHSAMYADRPCPVFSKVAAILSHIENKALMVLCDKVLEEGSVSESLIFDGLLTKVQDFSGKAKLAVAVAEASCIAGVEFEIEALPRRCRHLRFARAFLRHPLTVVIRREHRRSKGGELPRVSCRLGTGVPKTAVDEDRETMNAKEFNEFEMYHSQRDTAEIPRFIEDAADHVFHHDHPGSCAYGAIEGQSALALAHCSSVRILDGQRAALWDPTAPSVEMHLSVADLEVLAEGLTWFSLERR